MRTLYYGNFRKSIQITEISVICEMFIFREDFFMENAILAKKIKDLCKRKNTTITKMLTDLSLSKSIIYDLERRNSSISFQTLNRIAQYLDTTVDYFLDNVMPISNIVTVPVYGRVSAGIGVFADDEIIGEQPVFNNMVKNTQDCFCLKVEGDSMLPRIQDGDIILVRKQTSVDSGDYAVVLIDDENGVVKKVEYDADSVTLISINPNYHPRTFSGPDVQRLQVIGKVIQSISNFN